MLGRKYSNTCLTHRSLFFFLIFTSILKNFLLPKKQKTFTHSLINLKILITFSLQQVRQMPIFLGRKRREVDSSVGYDQKDDVATSASFSEAPSSLTTETYTEDNDDINIAPTTETISFTLDGRPEKYIVARHVDVDISYEEEPDETLEDSSVETSDHQPNHIQNSEKRSEI